MSRLAINPSHKSTTQAFVMSQDSKGQLMHNDYDLHIDLYQSEKSATSIKVFSPPYHVSIMDRNGYPYCSGALIDKNWVITSASCYKTKIIVQLTGNAKTSTQRYLLLIPNDFCTDFINSIFC